MTVRMLPTKAQCFISLQPFYTYISQPKVRVASEVYHYQLPRQKKNCFDREEINCSKMLWVSRDSSVGIATRCGPDGTGIESRSGRVCLYRSRTTLEPRQPPIQWVQRYSRGEKRPGRVVGHLPPSSAEVK